MNFYADSVRLMPAFQPTMHGKENAGKYYNAWLHRFKIQSCSRQTLEIINIGGRVIETGTFRTIVRPGSSQADQTLAGKYIAIWLKVAGNIFLFTEAWNYDSYYGEFHQQLKFDEVSAVVVAFGTQAPVDDPISFELAALNQFHGITVSAGDASRWSQFFADDAILMANYFPSLNGRHAIDEYIRMHVKELPVFEKLDIRNDRIDVIGEFIIEYASHVANWRAGEFSGVSTGKNLRIWKRQPDCSLKMFRQIAMYD